MLVLLHIENIAVIESADVEFSSGFNVLTGETGAGKSIVIDAISAVMGERISREIIRTGAPSALVSGLFYGDFSWAEELGIEPNEDGELLISRSIQADGKNICRINGKPASVTVLKEIGDKLVNIHGQHDSRQLFDESRHLGLLDSFGEAEALLKDYGDAFKHMTELEKEIKAFNIDESLKLRKIESLQFQINELEDARLKPGEDKRLSSRRKVLQNAEKLIECVEAAHFAMSGDENSSGAVSLLTEATDSFIDASEINGEYKELCDRLSELRYSAEDIASELRGLAGGFDSSAEELEKVESRLDVLYKLKRKYGSSVEEMITYLDKCREELSQIETSEESVKKLKVKLGEAEKEARRLAENLTALRKVAAASLEEKVLTQLKQLDMPNVRFSVELTENEDLGSSGADEARFLFSANMGEELKAMSKVASGGELARISLALKNVLAENDVVATLIFDEVDSGVSGRAAQKVAEKLKSVSEKKQVLCVTHLPQIAAMADTHFSIEKGAADGRTLTKVTTLDFDGRKAELARLLGGAKITETTLKSAEEMLHSASGE